MSFMENLLMALSSLKAHKMRSILTMLGIIIGVGAVIIVVAIGQGGEAMLKTQITGPGNTVELFYQPSDEEIRSNPNIFLQAPFKQEDIRALEQIQEIKSIVASSTQMSSVRYKQETADASSTGINQAYLKLNEMKVEKGRSFSNSDFLGGRRVGLVSLVIQEELFKGDNPVGEVIKVANQPIEIIGVLEKPTGLLSFSSMEVYLPFQTWRTIYGSSDFTQVTLQADSSEQLQIAGEKAAKLLNNIHNTEDSYQVLNMEEIAAELDR
jgi:putative ABC transport system permease protein